MILVVKMLNVKQPHTGQFVNAPVDGLEILILSAFNTSVKLIKIVLETRLAKTTNVSTLACPQSVVPELCARLTSISQSVFAPLDFKATP
jgi:hypothetical protein